MLKLLKYEFRKTMLAKLVVLGLSAVLEVVFLYGLFTDSTAALSTGAGLLVLLTFTGMMIIGIQSIVVLHNDMNTRQGYMLFMTPHSTYAMLGAKVLEITLSLMVTGVFFFGLGLLDVTLLFGKADQLKALVEMAQQFLRTLNSEIALNAGNIAALAFGFTCGWLCTVLTAYLADVVASALMRGKRFCGLVSFILFLALNWACARVMQLVPAPAGMIPMFVTAGAVYLALAAVMYVGAATIMDRRLSV